MAKTQDLIREFLNKNRRKPLNIHCVGDAMIDEYYSVNVSRISPEFPMPIMTSEKDSCVRKPGGIANVAYQFNYFNVVKTLVCFSDKKAWKVFSDHNIRGWNIYGDINAKLPIKRRFLDNGIQVTRHDIEQPLCGLKLDTVNHFTDTLGKSLRKNGANPDVVILSDYGKGFFASDEERVIDFYSHCKTIVDPKSGPLSKWKGCTIFKPNSKEAETLSGKKNWREQAKHLQNELECESVVITFGGEKVAGVHKDEFFSYVPDRKVEVDSVVGAGDCFVAFFAMAIGHGFEVPDAAEVAWNAGAVYVQKNMNSPICPAELVSDRIIDPADLEKRNFKIVFANGCFDILHQGHIETLRFAKSKGDKLVVALNSDESVARLKGPMRPIIPLEQRMAIISELRCVDYVLSFDSDSPRDIIARVKPEVLVKGDEYKVEEIIGADLVPTVLLAPMVSDSSTTRFANKLRDAQEDNDDFVD